MNALNSINETNQAVKGGQKPRGKYSYSKEPKEANTSTQSEYEEEDPIAFPAGPTTTTSTKKHELVKKPKNAGKGTMLGQKRQAGNSLVITNKTSAAAPPIGNMIGPPYPVYMQD